MHFHEKYAVDDTKTPDFWRSTVEDVNEFVRASVNRGRVEQIGLSSEGHPLWYVTYGPEARRAKATANFSAASGARTMEPFLGPASDDEPPILMLLCGQHGGEMEGIVGALNLLQIFETGKDFRGKAWSYLHALPDKARVIVVPCQNPDGRARVVPKSLVGASYDQFRYWCQGAWKNGELIGYPECKWHQPLLLDDVAFLGGYPNGQGYNIVHDASPLGSVTTEASAVLHKMAQERPDVVVHVHSCEHGPFFIVPTSLTPKRHQEVQIQMQRDAFERWDAADVRPHNVSTDWEGLQERPATYNYANASYDVSGALSITFEGPHGLAIKPFSHDEILDAHLVMYESVAHSLLDYPIRNRDLNSYA